MKFDYNKLIDEVLGKALLNKMLADCDKKTKDQLNAIVKILQKHGITINESIQIILELGVILDEGKNERDTF